MRSIFLRPYMSESFPEIGVMIAPAIRYAVRIHDDMPYEIWKSFIRSGIAGTSIVSAYITMVAIKLRIASVFHADGEIFSCSPLSAGFETFISCNPMYFFYWNHCLVKLGKCHQVFRYLAECFKCCLDVTVWNIFCRRLSYSKCTFYHGLPQRVSFWCQINPVYSPITQIKFSF